MTTQLETNMTTAKDIFLYIPNLIGYTRVIFMIISFVLMILFPSKWAIGIILYLLSFVGDLFDGMAARKFHQTSSFGGLLDMVTDRCATLGLLFVLSQELSNGALVFLILILLDISSHWCQMYASASIQRHHKSTTGNHKPFFLVRWYYQTYPFFGYCCVGTELTYILLFVLSHLNDTRDNLGIIDEKNFKEMFNDLFERSEPEKISLDWFCKIMLLCCLPACFIKQLVNVSQLCSACHEVASRDATEKNK